MEHSNTVADTERKLAAAVAEKTGVDEAAVSKVLSHLGLAGALQHRVAAEGKLDPDALNLRIAAGQILQ